MFTKIIYISPNYYIYQVRKYDLSLNAYQ